MASGFDRLSALPDNILSSHILCRLPLKEATKTSILSRRWRFLWRQIPHLKFEFDEGCFRREGRSHPRKYISDTINNILMLHSVALESFRYQHFYIFSNDFTNEVAEDLKIEQWIHMVAQKNVKQIYIDNWVEEVEIPVSIFACKQLTDLDISCFYFTKFPSNFEGFLFLRRLSLWGIELITGEEIERLVTLCPVLETLSVKHCTHITTLKIQALNLKNLMLKPDNILSLAADCPQLVRMRISESQFISKLHLNSCVLTREPSELESGSFRRPSVVKSLRKLSVKRMPVVVVPPYLPPRGSFPDLEELKLTTIDFLQEVDDEEIELAACNMIADFTFPNLQIAHVDMSLVMSEDGMRLVSVLLKNAPSLQTMFLILPYCINTHNQEFLENILDLEEIGSNANIKIVDTKEVACSQCPTPSSSSDDEVSAGGS